jgi:DNA-directed RNA polymerase specialized sigma24 family protein
MDAYAFPLRVYFLGTRDRWIGEPDDVVQGFFADRLGREDFFANWKASGKRLRHWLINGFCFYLKERHRELRRNGRCGADLPEPAFEDNTAADRMDRAWVMGLVREALVEAEALCNAQRLGDHWQIFVSHFYRDRPYESIAPDFGVEPMRAAVMARTAKRKFQMKLRELVRRDGVGEESVEAEINNLLAIAGVGVRGEAPGES